LCVHGSSNIIAVIDSLAGGEVNLLVNTFDLVQASVVAD
jgi:hypothetical protein